VHGLSESQIAFICERSIDKFLSIALILKGVIKRRIGHIEFNSAVGLLNEFELLVPVPIINGRRILCHEKVNDGYVVDNIQNEGFDLG
jgi:hypothetical protein